MIPLTSQISRFYRRWGALEVTFGADAASVLDFDLCPREPGGAPPAFASRWAALDAAEDLCVALASEDPANWHNLELARARMAGVAAYIRALMGERWAFGAYFEATMGLVPEVIPPKEIEESREVAAAALARLGYDFNGAGCRRYLAAESLANLDGFEVRLREEARIWVERLRSRVGLLTPGLRTGPGALFTVEVAEVDAYWCNWIEGSLETGIKLRANIHPRIRYTRSAPVTLAAHEIAGHAAHVLTLQEAERGGQLDTSSLNLTVHACEAFHMEGLAQAVLPLVLEPEEVPPDIAAREALVTLHHALIDNAQIALEAGAPIDEVLRDALAASPYLADGPAQLNLRDRLRHPLFRAYQAVYGPSRRLFLRAADLPMPARMQFMRRMYSSLLTPRQIRADLEAALAAVNP